MNNQTYQKLIVRLNPKCEDLWVAHCFEQGASGIETTNENASYITMATYFTDMTIQMQDVFVGFYQQFRPDNSDIQLLNLETHTNKNWLEAWKVHFRPISINEYLLVCPPWDVPTINNSKQLVIINPGNGFGSGSHPSTMLALDLLSKYLKQSIKKLSILDVGTGSGILLIAARKLGANQLVGLDIDLLSIIDAKKNFQRNALHNIRTVCGAPDCIQSPFDIVISNMMRHEIQSVRDDLLRNMGPSGVLILSGFYVSQKNQILDCFSDLQVIVDKNHEKWGGVIMKAK
jgi:ribosomal protein L11 methyltransferase